MSVKRYRCRSVVEAMQWDGKSREALISWHERKTGSTPMFEGMGVARVLLGDEWHALQPGEWLVWFVDDGGHEFIAMDDEQFVAGYEAQVS